MKYVESIIRDFRWVGYDWGEKLFFASAYFDQLYEFAARLIRAGKGYVDSQTEEEIGEHRGTVTEAGRESPCRDRSVEENLDLFARMRAGGFPDGAHVLRAQGDMVASHMKQGRPAPSRTARVPPGPTGRRGTGASITSTTSWRGGSSPAGPTPACRRSQGFGDA